MTDTVTAELFVGQIKAHESWELESRYRMFRISLTTSTTSFCCEKKLTKKDNSEICNWWQQHRARTQRDLLGLFAWDLLLSNLGGFCAHGAQWCFWGETLHSVRCELEWAERFFSIDQMPLDGSIYCVLEYDQQVKQMLNLYASAWGY